MKQTYTFDPLQISDPDVIEIEKGERVVFEMTSGNKKRL